jgi:hypothetical protein
MKNSDLIQYNIDNTRALTQETIDLLENKNYSSGRLVNVGDKILFAFLNGEYQVVIITFHPQEYGTLYEADNGDREIGHRIPELKYKK